MTDLARRRFVQFLAASPLLSAVPADEWRHRVEQALTIRSPEDALSVMDFEPAARAALPAAHFAYMASGVDDDATLRANREGYAQIKLRPRRLINVRNVDTTMSLFGQSFDAPIVVCPCGSQKGFHAEGEVAVARAAKRHNLLQMLSGVSTTSVEDVNAARGHPVWYQLYPTDIADIAHKVAQRAQNAGCTVLVVTVDLNAGRNLETQLRGARVDQRDCTACHRPGIAGNVRRKPMFDGIDVTRATTFENPAMDWAYLARLRAAVPRMKLVLKGIVSREDAVRAVAEGVDGIVVSNHGGRAEESGKATIESLAPVVAAVRGRIPVLLDGGVRRGSDAYKALALGAHAVGVGRPYLWGLAAFGQPGVEMVLNILRRELELAMRQMGTTTLAAVRQGTALDR